MKWLLLIFASYLLGSVPFGLIIARLHGVDLRKVGSGNIGATNVVRALGKKLGVFCFLLDVCKGLLPMLLVSVLGWIDRPPQSGQLLLWLSVGAAAIIGHVFPLYLKFKGGKGVATGLGVVLGLWPYLTVCGIIAFVIWLVALKIWRYVSLASILAAGSFPVSLAAAIAILESWSFQNLWPLILASVILPLLIIWRHRSNISRLIAGTENKVGTSRS